MFKESFLQILLTVTASAIFIIVFYFTYGKTVEGDLVKKQMTGIVSSYTRLYSVIAGDEEFAGCSYIVAPDTSETDHQIEIANEALLNKAYTTMAIGFGIVCVVIAGTWYIGRKPIIPFKTMIARTLLNLAAVAAVEYIFLTQIIANHVSVDSSNVSGYVLDGIIKYA